MDEPHAAVAALLNEFLGFNIPLSDDADLFASLSIEGDDASSFLETLFAKFEIDASGYRWYFHHGEEGWNFGGLFFRPPYRRFDRIPITLKTLVEAVETKKWPIIYPAHELPKVRWDLRINLVFVAFILVGLALYVGRSLLN